MKAKLCPMIFREANEREKREYQEQLNRLKEMYGNEAEFLDPVTVGEAVPPCDALLFPQMIGAGYHYREHLKAYGRPVLVITSQFGTVDMWDWELISYLRSGGLTVFSPYSIELGKVILRAMAAKTYLKGAKFLMFQDDPGEGMQAYIFKRFYWWEEECTRQIGKAFGAKLIYRSWKEVNERAEKVDMMEALDTFRSWNLPHEGISETQQALLGQLYIAIRGVIDELGGVDGIGANCLNESMYCKTTPCVIWNQLFEQYGIIWCCEGDTLTLLSTFVL